MQIWEDLNRKISKDPKQNILEIYENVQLPRLNKNKTLSYHFSFPSHSFTHHEAWSCHAQEVLSDHK